ncbi:hypothetical protein RS130_22995 [Paraglaciecola aquimarina]|uniref:Sulfotransferase domain-containing protein n=1 Tax=Paraglaciecola aquimarina TaxID=1235557 RepID=A0ABU3T2C2_9ALTE|nr:hypothetical protein [Paraglaciecola aquimarina]MDU0356375.1 hypothetical protein [Paraglaciecola aquimarina]
MKTLYFHVGTPKTGTTTLQEFCLANNETLEQSGLYYPNTPELLNNRSANGFLLVSNQKDRATRAKCWEKYLNSIAKTDAKNILVSEEIFFLMPNIEMFSELKFKGYQVKFIIYLRPSFEYLCSFWSEMCRVHEPYRPYLEYPLPLEQFLLGENRYTKDLQKIITLAELFGNDNIIIRTFEKTSFVGGDLISDFMSIFGLPSTLELKSIDAQNPNNRSRKMLDTINILQTANILGSFLHDISTSMQDPKDVEADFEYLLGTIGGDLNAQESVSDEVIEKVVAKYAIIESAFAEQFLNRKQLFTNNFPSVYQQPRPHYKGLSNEELLKINIFVQNKIYAMRPSYQKLWRKIEKKLYNKFKK